MPRQVLADEIWDKLQPLLPKPKGRYGKDDRMFLEAVCWIVRTGAPWRDLPQEFGSWKTVYNRYNRWAKKGAWTRSWSFLKKDGDHEWHMIDGSIIRAHRHAAGARGGQEQQELGRSCGGFSSKIHAKADAIGMPLGFIITPGQSSDIGQAGALVGEELCESLLADKGYDSNTFREFLKNRGSVPVVPGKKNRIESIE